MASQTPPRYNNKDMSIIIDSKSNHDWIVPRRVMCAFFWLGIILLFTGIILLVTSKHKGEVYRSWGGILLGLGFCLLLICLVLCLHAYCVITITEEQPLNKRTVPPPPPSVIMNGRKPRTTSGESSDRLRDVTAAGRRGKPVQLLIVEKDEPDEVEGYPEGRTSASGKESPIDPNLHDDATGGASSGRQTSTVSHPVLGDVHVSVRPANPGVGSSSFQNFDVESTETSLPISSGAGTPLSFIFTTNPHFSSGNAVTMTSNTSSPERTIIPSQYAKVFSPIKTLQGAPSSAAAGVSNENTYFSYDGLALHPLPVGPLVTCKPPPIPGRHSSQVHAHVIPIPLPYRNYSTGIVPPPPQRTNISRVATQNMSLREQASRINVRMNGQQANGAGSDAIPQMPENYIQRIPPSHGHDVRRFSQPVVVYLDPNQELSLSKLSVYDNVQYVWTDTPPTNLPQ